MDVHGVRTDLTSIRGIGPKTAEALASLGVTDLDGLLARRSDADALRRALSDAGVRGLTSDRLASWFEAAARRRASAIAAPPAGDAPTSGIGRPGEFTIFFDSPEPGGDWSCRVYHAESGEDQPFDGLRRWLPWVAEKLGIAVADLVPDPSDIERTAAPGDVRHHTGASRLQVLGVDVAATGDRHLTFDVRVDVPDDVIAEDESPTVHVDLICLDADGRVALAESWDDVAPTSPHVTRRTTMGLGPGVYDVRVMVTLAVHEESAERAVLLELIP